MLVRYLAGAMLLLSGMAGARADDADDRRIADALAEMLRAGRTVISESQARINDATLGDKDLGGAAVLARSVAIFRTRTGIDPGSIDPASRDGRLLRAEMDAIVAVMDANKASLDAPGKGFKGFIPAVFSRLVAEEFSRRTDGLASMKVTAPSDLVRNRRAMPDAWEAEVIAQHFVTTEWPKGQPFQQVTTQGRHDVFRIGVPEYYTSSCLSCHGGPKGALDITGYPMEGAKVGDLGGVISIKLARN